MITLICALPDEAKYLRRLTFVQNGTTQLICSGIGPRNAQRAIRELLATSKPTLVISTGVAGALSPTLQIGDIVDAREVIDQATGQRFPCSDRPTIRGSQSKILCVSHMITSADEKKALGREYGAVAVDMESAAIARVCTERGVPFAAIRSISDTADEVLPEAITRFFDANGHLRPGKVIAELIKSPSLLKALRRLQVQTATATGALRKRLEENPLQ